MSSLYSLEHDWVQSLSESQPIVAEMLARDPDEQRRLGYVHTLREICQQPWTWVRTAELMQQLARVLSPLVEGISGLVLSGSGSSDFAGDCVRMVLQKELRVNTQAVPGARSSRREATVSPWADPG